MKLQSFRYGILLAVVALLTIVPRLYKLTAPVADWHSFRQVDTASVAREFMKKGIDVLHPTYHDLSNIQSGKDNPNGWRMVEFPAYQALGAILSRMVPSIPLEVWLRIVTIGFAALTALIITDLLKRLVSERVGIFAGISFALLPYGIFYGRTILPETMAVALALLSILILVWDGDYEHKRSSMRSFGMVAISALAAAIAILVKPTAGFLLLPVPYVLYRNGNISVRTAVSAVLFAAVTLLPFYWWRGWIQQYPEGIAAFDWLFNKGNIRFKGAWFQWLFADRIGRLILGFWGLIPFGIGLMSPNAKKEGWTISLLTVGGLLYFAIIAGGNVQHDYYQIIILPIIAIYLGKGIDWIFHTRQFSWVARFGVLGVSLLFMAAFSWFTIRTYYWINRPEIIEAGRMADSILPNDAKVIAPYNGDTTFLYQTKRTGWPLGFDIDQKISMGATHYVTVSPTDQDFETMTLAKKYMVLVRNEKFAIIDLTKPTQ